MIFERLGPIAPRKSYLATKSPILIFWSRIPQTPKYFAFIGGIAASLIHLNPNTIFTVGPPLMVGGIFAQRSWKKWLEQKQVNKVVNSDEQIRLKPYDDMDIQNVIHGIETSYDHFQNELLGKVELALKESKYREMFSQDDQFIAKIGSFETYIRSDYGGEEFIKVSTPVNDRSRKRMGTIECYLLGENTYKFRIDYTPLSMFPRSFRVI